MKNLLLTLGAALVLSPSVWAQTPLVSGRIVYEAMQKIDPSQMRIVINGQEVRPGGPDAPPDLPDTRSFEMTLRFANGHAKEEREGGGANMVMRRMQGPGPGGSDGPGPGGPPPTTRNLGRPFEESTFLDLAGRKYVEVVSIPKDLEKKE
ncbi:MAG: GLPGLI family protein, partial [Sphingobacteriaceae bacterium]|nr:GLPGLI family protein [Cytophagaceae bacterium]